MKKTFLFLALTAPMFALAQTGSTKPEQKVEAKVEIKKDETAAVEEKKEEQKPSETTEVKAEVAKVQLTPELLTSTDLKDAGLSLAIVGEKIQIKGRPLPESCAKRVSLSNVEYYNAEKDISEEGAQISSKKDLNKFASSVAVQVTFLSDGTGCLRDCILNAPADEKRVDISNDEHFARAVAMSPEIMIAGISGETPSLKSAEYLKMEKKLSKLDCKECNVDSKARMEHLAEAKDNPLFASLVSQLYSESVKSVEEKLAAAKNQRHLSEVKAQLDEMLGYASTDLERDAALAIYSKLIDANDAMAHSGHKTESETNKHIDFKVQALEKMASVPGLSAEGREELEARASELKPGTESRLEYLSSIDGDHPEVREYLEVAQAQQRDLQREAQFACMGRRNMYNFARCGEAQAQLNAFQYKVNGMQARYTQADNEKWSMFFGNSAQGSVAPSFAGSSAPSTGNYWSGNSQAQMQQMALNQAQPQGLQYSNFNASAMYMNQPQQGWNSYNGMPVYNMQPNSYYPH